MEDIEVNLNIRLSVDNNGDITLFCPRCFNTMKTSSKNIKSICLNINGIECYFKEPRFCSQDSCLSANSSKLNYALVTSPIPKGDLCSSQLKPDDIVSNSDDTVATIIRNVKNNEKKIEMEKKPVGVSRISKVR